MRRLLPLYIGAAALAVPAVAAAHFILHQPTPILEQNALGDPQKMAPCGGTSADAGKPTGAVTDAVGGSLLHIKIQEAVFHPGHYRVALGVAGMSDLPADPETTTRPTERGPYSVSAKIEAKPKPPVLADGLFVHTERPAPGSFWETDIKLPNIDCTGCMLQVIQWMGEHGLNKDGDYSYHHCVAMRIKADPLLPRDKRWSARK
jgi:hypothetical protein